MSGFQDKFVFITPAYNCQNIISQTCMSVIAQSFKDWRMIVYDDMSTDQTPQVVSDISKSLRLGDKLKVISRDKKFGEVHNTLDAVQHVEDDEIVCRLDGGDWLTDNDTLDILSQVYTTHEPAVTWTKQRWAYTDYNISGPLSSIDADVYKHPWVSSHLKTFRKNAINDIALENFKDDNGDWIMIACDQAVFLPMLHKAYLDHRPRLFLPVVCYHYNIDLQDKQLFTCDRSITQKTSAEWIRERGYLL